MKKMYSTPEKLFSKFRPKRVVKKIQHKKIRKIFERQSEIRKKEHRQRSLILNHRIVRVRKRIKHILQNRKHTHPNRHVRQIPIGLSQILLFRRAQNDFTSIRDTQHRKRIYRYLGQILPHDVHRVNIDYDFERQKPNISHNVNEIGDHLPVSTKREMSQAPVVQVEYSIADFHLS